MVRIFEVDFTTTVDAVTTDWRRAMRLGFCMIESYNQVTLHGRTRQFPVRELLGAECIIARLWHERHISKNYTPLQLGELLQHRSFSANGDINPLARSPRKTSVLSLDEDKQLIEADDPTWTPRSLIGGP